VTTAQLRPAPAEPPGSAASRLADSVRARSGGNVVAIPASGPVLQGRRVALRRLSPDTLVPVLSGRDRVAVAALSLGWLVSLVAFWVWWFSPEHRVSWVGTAVNSALLCYISLVPSYFLFSINRIRRTNPAIATPPLRVAFVVTKAPSEPWAVAERTLSAMLAQDFPYRYDVWLCDEDPSEHTVRWCREHRVSVSTRHGRADYHRPSWPRRTRCKEGNLSFFYDHWGYDNYDVVAQLDCDHVPEPTYLDAITRSFADPAVGYVGAPSVCDSNAAGSWSARGRLDREASFHGPIQAGHNNGMAPVCIGSHYAVRTQALAQIGGVGPELAEDFSTAFLLNSAGWQGAFALDAEAHGEGPPTFAAMVVQEFQWSRSLTTVLLELVPKHLRRLPWRLRLRFLYALLYYVLLSVTTVIGVILPPVAAVSGLPWVRVNYVEFLLRWGIIATWLVAVTLLLRRRRLLRPVGARVVSWELWLYALARWPYIAHGVLAALRGRFWPRPVDFRVTPKSHGGLEPLPVRLIVPYVAIVLVLAGAAVIGELTTTTAGYVFLCLLGAGAYAVVALAVPALHAVETARAAGVPVGQAVRLTARRPLAVAALCLLPLTPAVVYYPVYATRVLGW